MNNEKWVRIFLSAVNLFSLSAFIGTLLMVLFGFLVPVIIERIDLKPLDWLFLAIWLVYLVYIIRKTVNIQTGKKIERWHVALFWLGLFALYFLSIIYFFSQIPSGGGWAG